MIFLTLNQNLIPILAELFLKIVIQSLTNHFFLAND
jgi:hypothetical protein